MTVARGRVRASLIALQALSIAAYTLLLFYPIELRGPASILRGSLAGGLVFEGYGVSGGVVLEGLTLLSYYILVVEIGLLVVQVAVDRSRGSEYLELIAQTVAFNLLSYAIFIIYKSTRILAARIVVYGPLTYSGLTLTAQPIVRLPSLPVILAPLALSGVALAFRVYRWLRAELEESLVELEWEAIVYVLVIFAVLLFTVATPVVLSLPRQAVPAFRVSSGTGYISIGPVGGWAHLTLSGACLNWRDPAIVVEHGGEIMVYVPASAYYSLILNGYPRNVTVWVEGSVKYATGVEGRFTGKFKIDLHAYKPRFTVRYENGSVIVSSVNYPASGIRKILVFFYKDSRFIGSKTVMPGSIRGWPIVIDTPDTSNHAIVRIYYIAMGRTLIYQYHIKY